MSTLTLLLPRAARALPSMPRLLGNADALPSRAPGVLPALAAAFGMSADTLPVAALLRQAHAGDAGRDAWLCADPVFVQPDLADARLLAWGAMALQPDEATELARALRPTLGDAGLALETTLPSRWQLRLAPGTPLPTFTRPEQALGASLLAHLPSGSEARRWHALFNEMQMLLHEHPVNRARRSAGRPPVNALWFWGAGTLPPVPTQRPVLLICRDPLAHALAIHAGSAVGETLSAWNGQGDCFMDAVADAAQGTDEVLAAAGTHVRAGSVLELAFDDGQCWRITRRQRWRVWRRPLIARDSED